MEKAALSLVSSALSPIFSKLAEKASSYFGGDITEDDLDNLKIYIIPRIQTVLQQSGKIDAATLKPWLMKLKADAYEGEDILDLYEYHKIEEEVSSSNFGGDISEEDLNNLKVLHLPKIETELREAGKLLEMKSRKKHGSNGSAEGVRGARAHYRRLLPHRQLQYSSP